MNFRKIKYNKARVVLAWGDLSPSRELDTTLESVQAPHPDLTNALQAFRRPVLELLELADVGYEDGFTVVGVSLTTQEDGRRGVVVTCLKKLEGANAPLVLNTPYLAEPSEQNPDDDKALTGTWLELVEALEDEARAFIDGKRSQGDLFATAANTAEREAAGV